MDFGAKTGAAGSGQKGLLEISRSMQCRPNTTSRKLGIFQCTGVTCSVQLPIYRTEFTVTFLTVYRKIPACWLGTVTQTQKRMMLFFTVGKVVNNLNKFSESVLGATEYL